MEVSEQLHKNFGRRMPVAIEQESGWAPQTGRFGEKKNFLPLPEIEP